MAQKNIISKKKTGNLIAFLNQTILVSMIIFVFYFLNFSVISNSNI